MLLILAAVSLSAVFSDKGIFSRAEESGAKYNEAKAREVLETVLLADGQYEKNLNPEYNQDDFLDELIISEISGSRIQGDVAIIGGWAFELDRSVPKIGRGLGKADKLIFPTLNATAELANDKKNATINITAKEEKNGINKIEIWLLGEKIQEYTYDPTKPEAIEAYIATQNGKYTIKAYGDLMESKTVDVTGIMPWIEFQPNGNTTWEKEHSTRIKVQQTDEKIKTMKYQWTNSVTEPTDNTFIQECIDEDTITGKGDNMIGQYYLWILLETENGTTSKRRSEAFNFDNEKPTITSFTATKYSETGITLSATAQDTKSGIVKFEFYIDGTLKDSYTQTITATTASVTKTVNITGLTTGNHTCMVKIYDAKNNNNSSSKSGTTKLYAWEKWSITETYSYTTSSNNLSKNWGFGDTVYGSGADVKVYNWGEKNGYIDLSGCKTGGDWSWMYIYRYCCSCTGLKILFNNYEPAYGNKEANQVLTNINIVKNEKADYDNKWHVTGSLTTYKFKTVYSKGNTSSGTVTSLNKSSYPSNGKLGEYWYIYKGVQ